MGVAEGAFAQGCEDCGAYVTRAVVLANAPGDVQDFLLILLREFVDKMHRSGDGGGGGGGGGGSDRNLLLAKIEKALSSSGSRDGMHCSMFAVWGSRTVKGELFSARNLDWNKDTGINKNKLVMVMVPDDGAIASVSLGFAGLYGTLAGMSASGLTVHEANLEEDIISFRGFPWVLRLRFIMEFAQDISTAQELWSSTNNTVGFNHMVASAKDAHLYSLKKATSTGAIVMETMYRYTAYFKDNDSR